ncbi:MAG TPA: DUF3471 domain-containing protein [Rhodothermales bacterium]|nr:DUF3471 domain-containing protein [Rhodothermales bacterium]
MPKQGIGVVAMINENAAGFFLPDFVANCAYALILDEDGAEICDAEREDLVQQAHTGLEQIRQTFQVRPDMPPRPLAAYTGRYYHPAMGSLAIARRGEQLHAVLGLVETVLDPWQGDILRMEFGGAGTALNFDFSGETTQATSVTLQGYQMDRMSAGTSSRFGN